MQNNIILRAVKRKQPNKRTVSKHSPHFHRKCPGTFNIMNIWKIFYHLPLNNGITRFFRGFFTNEQHFFEIKVGFWTLDSFSVNWYPVSLTVTREHYIHTYLLAKWGRTKRDWIIILHFHWVQLFPATSIICFRLKIKQAFWLENTTSNSVNFSLIKTTQNIV